MDFRGTLALAINVLAWAATPVLLSLLTGRVDAWTANGLRYPLSALGLAPIVWLAWRRGELAGGVWRLALVPAALSLGGQILWALSPYYLPADMIGFLLKGSIAWAICGAMVLFPEERCLLRSSRFWGGLVLAVGGFVALTIWRGAFDDPVTLRGGVIMFFCCALFGLYGVSVRRFMHGVPSLAAFGVVAQYVAVGVLVLMLLFGDVSAIGRLDATGWGLITGSSFLGIALAHVLFFVAIQRLGPSISTGAHLAGPFLTLALAGWVFGTALAGREWIAGAAMVGGGALLLYAQRGIPVRAESRAAGRPRPSGGRSSSGAILSGSVEVSAAGRPDPPAS